MIILIKTISTSVRDFDQNKHDITEFAQITFNMSVKFNKKSVLFKLSCETHVIDNLSTNMFIDTDTLDSHEIVIDIIKNQIIMNVCQNTIINLLIKFKVNHQIWFVYNKQQVVISLKFHAQLSIKLAVKHILSDDWEFIFTSEYCNIILYAYLTNANFIFVHAVNLFDKSIKILLKVRLDFLINFDKTEVYLVKSEAAELACVDQENLSHFDQDNLSCRLVNSTCSETVLLSDITVYDNEEIIRALSEIINHYDI